MKLLAIVSLSLLVPFSMIGQELLFSTFGPGESYGPAAGAPPGSGDVGYTDNVGAVVAVPFRPSATACLLARILRQVTATVGDRLAQVSYAGIVGAGLDQINIVVPDVAAGDQQVIVALYDQTQGGVFLPVAPR